jgi:hypothetical protein
LGAAAIAEDAERRRARPAQQAEKRVAEREEVTGARQ